MYVYMYTGLPGSSAGKESAFNAEDPGLISGSERFPGEGIGYPLQYSQASLVAQMVKNPPAGTSLVVQWLRPCAPNAGGPGSIPGQGTRSHVLQLRPGTIK